MANLFFSNDRAAEDLLPPSTFQPILPQALPHGPRPFCAQSSTADSDVVQPPASNERRLVPAVRREKLPQYNSFLVHKLSLGHLVNLNTINSGLKRSIKGTYCNYA